MFHYRAPRARAQSDRWARCCWVSRTSSDTMLKAAFSWEHQGQTKGEGAALLTWSWGAARGGGSRSTWEDVCPLGQLNGQPHCQAGEAKHYRAGAGSQPPSQLGCGVRGWRGQCTPPSRKRGSGGALRGSLKYLTCTQQRRQNETL